MNLSPQPPSSNGHHPAPPAQGGDFAAPRPRTVFPPEPSRSAGAGLLYALGRARLGEAPLLRLLWILGALLALADAALPMPRGLWLGGAILFALLVLTITTWAGARRRFVTFSQGALPQLTPAALLPADKVPVWVTGRLSVEGRERDFTWLPGFYRTFATREHALLCLCRPRRLFGVARWPQAEAGLWYAFFKPQEMLDVYWGTLHFGKASAPALAVTHTPQHGAKKRRNPETLYIAAEDETLLRRILADLLFDTTPVAHSLSRSH